MNKRELYEANLNLQLEDLKKSAKIAWDELDKSHASRAMLHDELVIAEGQRDQARAERDALKAEVDTLHAQHAPPRMVTGWCAECKGSGYITTHSSSANGGSVTTRKCSCGGAPLLINATADFWSVQSSKENTHES